MSNQNDFKVFLSHAQEDFELVHRVWNILFRLKADPYMHELYPDYRQDIPTSIRAVLRTCMMCVTFLTKYGINSQWVQQELGIAYAFNKVIVPVIETGVEYKGFVQMVRRIPYNPENPDPMTSQVIYAVRKHVIGHEKIPSGLALTCLNGHEHDYDLPSNREINQAIEKGHSFFYECMTCGIQIKLNPHTLETISEGG
jgi:hypothetical protein